MTDMTDATNKTDITARRLTGAYALHVALQAISAYRGRGLQAFGGTFAGGAWLLTGEGYAELERVLSDAGERTTGKHRALVKAWDACSVRDVIAPPPGTTGVGRIADLEEYAGEVRAGMADLPARHRDLRDAIALGLVSESEAMNSDD